MVKSMLDKKYEAEDAARTLMRAEEIKANKQLFTSAKKELVKQQRAVAKAIGKNKK